MDMSTRVPPSYVDSIASDLGSLPEPIRDALLAVRRHRFLDEWFRLEITNSQASYRRVDFNRDAPSEEHLSLIYSNNALITAHNGVFPTSSTSQPPLVARMLQLLDVAPGMRILEIGTGTGYNAALLSEIAGNENVYSVELQPHVSERASRFLKEEGYEAVHALVGDGFYGIEEAAPFDRIVATVGCSDISPHWLEQLSPGGIMLVPLHQGFTDPLVRITRHPEDAQSAVGAVADRSAFMQIQGVLAWGNPWQTYQIRRLPKDAEWVRRIPKNLVLSDTCQHPFCDHNHWCFHFFLTLCSRELWYDNTGYGLSDPSSKSVVKFTKRGIEGISVNRDSEALERLHRHLVALHKKWSDLGCPSPSDYLLRFTPKNQADVTPFDPAREWNIERLSFLESFGLA